MGKTSGGGAAAAAATAANDTRSQKREGVHGRSIKKIGSLIFVVHALMMMMLMMCLSFFFVVVVAAVAVAARGIHVSKYPKFAPRPPFYHAWRAFFTCARRRRHRHPSSPLPTSSLHRLNLRRFLRGFRRARPRHA